MEVRCSADDFSLSSSKKSDADRLSVPYLVLVNGRGTSVTPTPRSRRLPCLNLSPPLDSSLPSEPHPPARGE